MAGKHIMYKQTHSAYMNRGYTPHCINCKCEIKIGDKYVSKTHYGGGIRKTTPKLYCIPCADTLNII